jgi:hypothetical protein
MVSSWGLAKRILKMQDILYIAMGSLFFVIAIAYVFACERLRGASPDE